jgi:hypothetical protein
VLYLLLVFVRLAGFTLISALRRTAQAASVHHYSIVVTHTGKFATYVRCSCGVDIALNVVLFVVTCYSVVEPRIVFKHHKS